jgi:hypothetical protein
MKLILRKYEFKKGVTTVNKIEKKRINIFVFLLKKMFENKMGAINHNAIIGYL